MGTTPKRAAAPLDDATSPTAVRPWHHDARGRLGIALVAGLVIAGVSLWLFDPAYAPLLGWAVASLTFCVVSLTVILPMDAEATASHATREVPGAVGVHILMVCAALASLVGIGFLIFNPPDSRLAAAGVCLLVVAASWMAVQTLHTLGYARQYYKSQGIDFHCDEAPSYWDFAYIAFTVGMSFAVSDTDMTNTAMRKIAITHALLAYLFGTVFVAALINILASLSG